MADLWGVAGRLGEAAGAAGHPHRGANWLARNVHSCGRASAWWSSGWRWNLSGVSCLELEEVQPDRKNICCSRSFGRPVESLEELREAVAIARHARRGEAACAGVGGIGGVRVPGDQPPRARGAAVLPAGGARIDCADLVHARTDRRMPARAQRHLQARVPVQEVRRALPGPRARRREAGEPISTGGPGARGKRAAADGGRGQAQPVGRTRHCAGGVRGDRQPNRNGRCAGSGSRPATRLGWKTCRQHACSSFAANRLTSLYPLRPNSARAFYATVLLPWARSRRGCC